LLAKKSQVKQNKRIMIIDAYNIELGVAVDIRSGYPFRGAVEEVAAGGALVVQMKDVDISDGVLWPGAVRAVLQGRKQPEWLQGGDLLFVTRGSRFFAVCIAAPPEPAVCGPHLLHLRVRPGCGIEPAFLAWQLNQPPLQRRLHAAAEGTSQLSIRVGEIAALGIAVPPPEQQARIVGLADAALHERQLLARLAHTREQQLAALATTLAKSAGLDT
jgi:hypothetical protein